MTTPESHPFQLTRRRALVGAAWSAPVIVAASAVPAFAGSPGGALTLRPGLTAAVPGNDGFDDFYDLQFTGLSVVVPTALTAGQLTLTVTFTPSGTESNLFVLNDAPGMGFTVSAAGGATVPSLVFTFGPAVVAGTEVQVPNGIFVGADQPIAVQSGTYVVTAAAPGLTSDSRMFATPSIRAARAMVPVRRPVL